MPHDTPLIATIVSGLVLAFAFGALANRLRISPIAGYLLAGVLVGPYTPGFVADAHLAGELAEIGVILLMFGVGLHFSLKDLMSVRAIAIPGAVVQIAVATAMGWALAAFLGWSLAQGLIFGLALSVASTVVLLRALQEKRLVQTERGRIAVGWLIVEDLAMVLALVLIPPFAGVASGEGQMPAGDVALALAITFGKVALFVAVMLIGGRWLVPKILHAVAHTGSRELFRLAVLSIALGIAFGAAKLFGVSFALGAFFAGMVLAESELSQRATEETLPLRDAFAVLFFVSVGMLFDPNILVERPLEAVAAVAIVVFGKSLAAFVIVRAFGHPTGTALTVSASLAQIGEFSFILANLAVALHMLPEDGRSLILAAAMISILINPAAFAAAERIRARLDKSRLDKAKPAGDTPAAAAAEPIPLPQTARTGHTILVGFGRVGMPIAETLRAKARPLVVIEDSKAASDAARALGFEVIEANGVDRDVLAAANVTGARTMHVAVPDGFEAGTIVERAKALNPALVVIARGHSDEERDHLKKLGADRIVMGERETGLAMAALDPAPPSA
ncbi:MAG: Kef family K(+) transporter [Alphaproteobacteria bacterium]|nr:Kef family K(+) transporter [Alphaproteobacteria bacterium]